MRKLIWGVLIVTATAAYGGFLYLELPPEYPASMVENAKAEGRSINYVNEPALKNHMTY